MKRAAIILALLAGCAAEAPSESSAEGELCYLEDGVWYGCGDPGPGGDDGGGSQACQVIDCSQDWQCQQACLTTNAVCIVIGAGPYVTGSCWP